MKNRFLLTATIFLFLLSFSGCIGVNREFKEIRNDVLSIIGKKNHKKFEFGLGAAGLTLAGSIVRFSEEDQLPADIISYLRSVQVGVYENHSRKENSNTKNLREFCGKMSDAGWQYIIRSVDEGEVSLIFIRKDLDDGIKEMLVVNNNEEELVILTLEGDLEEIVAVSIKSKNFGVAISN